MTRVLSLLESKPGDKSLLVALAVGALLCVISFFLFDSYEEVLRPSGYLTFDQQTVFTYEANQRILAAWQAIDGGIRASLMIAYIDLFPFMPAYAAMGFAWGILVARRRSGWLRPSPSIKTADAHGPSPARDSERAPARPSFVRAANCVGRAAITEGVSRPHTRRVGC